MTIGGIPGGFKKRMQNCCPTSIGVFLKKKFSILIFRKSQKIAKNDFLKTPRKWNNDEKMPLMVILGKNKYNNSLKFFFIFENLQTVGKRCKFKKLSQRAKIFTTSF